MDNGQSNSIPPNSTMDDVPLDVKPLRTLAPNAPSSYGGAPFAYGPRFPSPVVASNLPPPFPTPQQSPDDFPPLRQSPSGPNGRTKNPPSASVVPVPRKKIKKRARNAYKTDLASLPSCQDPRESVEIVLATYDALRRRLLQQDEAKDGKNGSSRPDLRAGTILMSNDLRANTGKRIGPVPGVEVGDIFYFRMELCVVGVHAQSMGGIDSMTSEFENASDTVAISVVSAGGYENDEGGVDVLIYSGQGGNANADQKLERGNLALERSLHRGTDVRVVRSAKDASCNSGKIYIYDGLYKVQDSWVEKGKSGFNVFKYKLVRKVDQPEGIAVWKRIQKWKENPASRGGIVLPDVSSGVENLPVRVVNEVDDEKGPGHFEYVTRVEYPSPSTKKPAESCECSSVCLPDDDACACARANGGNLPYSSSGLLVSRKPLVYECGASCSCSINCRNRLTQKGIVTQFEVFRTRDRGWGLRSLDPIRAGTYVCEYAGEVVESVDNDDDYVFQAAGDDKAFKWNYGPELLGEPTADYSTGSVGALNFRISARRAGNVSRFVNHSCSPNVFWQQVTRGHGDGGYPRIAFFAIKHIPPMTELTYDYGLRGSGGEPHEPKKCLCGSPKCRGLFG